MIRRLLAYALLALPLFAQKKQLTFEALYDPTTKISFSGAVQSDFVWIDDNAFLWPKKDERGKLVEWRVFDVATGKQRPFFDRAKLQSALEGAGLTADAAKDAAESDELTFDAKKSAVVLSVADDLYVYSFTRGTAVRITSAPGEEEEAAFSPDGQKVAFVRNHNLFVVDLAGRERQLTTDGSAEILNGKLDYVYQEEVYGRGVWKGYWWSPDSARIAFLQLDERPVPEYTIVDDIAYRPDVKVYDYPKAGDPNPRVKLLVARASGGALVTIDNERYLSGEFLIVNVAWNGDSLSYQVQNREQSWLELVFANCGGQAISPVRDRQDCLSSTILRETTKAWVDPLANPEFLDDGSFLWQSERSGWRHLYHYKSDGTLIRQVTNGEWEVRELHGADKDFAYFSGTERSHIGQDVYRIRFDGSGLQRLSSETGTHSATFSPAMVHYADRWSDLRTPDQVRVYRAGGKLAHVVDENRVAALAQYDLPRPELLQVKTRDGFVMEAMIIKPTNFDPSKKYPVYQPLYGGPHAPRVRNMWDRAVTRGLFHHLVAQQGVIVWICDNRTASGKGAVSAWPAYKNFGESELRDVEDGIAWLKQQPYIDGSRIMLHGWSYGGFMVAYAMTHSTTFSSGVSGAPVTDWRDYDSIYTERLMLMPQNNPEGYRKSSPRFNAKDLHGRLLLIHGTTDDNVHPQNTIQLAYELQRAGKQFELMMYPRTKHSVTDEKTVAHMQSLVLDFIRRNLLR
ncbi:MAG TPA: S9 family peptidase [Thermoanaerobaculia bacterium]|nr:S9 family peptidase [Thermoanaerobaculia bacterium]